MEMLRMAEYIERGTALMKLMQDGCSAKNLQSISDIPGADVAPVVHGWWIESNNFDIGFWVCSNCNFVSEAIAAPKLYTYCPNCGAKMDLE